MTAHVRTERFGDVEAVLAALGESTVAAAPEVDEQPPAAVERPIRQRERPPQRKLRLLTVCVGVALAIALGRSPLFRPRPRPPQPAPPKSAPVERQVLGNLRIAVNGEAARIDLDGVLLPSGADPALVRHDGYLKVSTSERTLLLYYTVYGTQVRLRFSPTQPGTVSIGQRPLAARESFAVGGDWVQVRHEVEGRLLETLQFSFQPASPKK